MTGSAATPDARARIRSATASDRRTADEDAAAVLVALLALTGSAPPAAPARRSVWGTARPDLAGIAAPGEHAWWASGLPR